MTEKTYVGFSSFPRFWYFYLSQHMKVGTRAFHYLGTLTIWIGLGLAVADLFAPFLGLGNLRWLLPVGGILITYILGFVSHWTIEKNQPATFVYPLLSVGGDLVMFWKMTIRTIRPDVEEVRRRLATGWVVNRYGLYPPDEAKARKLVSDRRVVPSAVA